MAAPDATFYCSIVLGMKHIITDMVPTAATNGTEVLYNPEFLMGITPNQRVGLILHETLHVVFMHMLRLGGRNHMRFNAAADYVINLIIENAGFELPASRLLDKKYKDMSAEEVYDLLPEQAEPPEGWDDLIEATGDVEVLKQHIDDIVIQAAIQSQMAGDKPGSIPGAIERYVDELLNPKVAWYRYMKSFAKKVCRSDYSTKKFNKRYLPEYYLPSLYSEQLGSAAVFMDTSGSITDSIFNDFMSETAYILKGIRPDFIYFGQWDTRVISVDKCKTVAELKKVKFHGGGGTCIEDTMRWAAENKPVLMVIFTDGYFSEPSINPKVPIIWVVHSNPTWKAPFGKVVYYEFEA